ncbi:MAG: class I SAM-dependent methyltransferase [Clostridiales bacterium]|nr:class I SAM-dependent methyltransferase [Clostridiales bacterium]MDD7366843.1 class I SAM-dependent methyltransferase [Clostridiales bacterium]MDY2873158.1 class I SAM-dependent methyltransferase [Eubacteriales bacterium]
MNFDFKSARHWAEELIRQAVEPGARVIDATMGNGYDTQWLAELVGESGHVYGFDIQLEAVNRTRDRLAAAGLENRATLFHAGHEHIAELVGEPVDAAVFNLGWLPGTDKALRTRAETTLTAVNAALDRLKEGALMTICVYPGHPEGRDELDRLIAWGRALPGEKYDVMARAYLNQSGDPPVLIAVKKNKTRVRKQG